MAKKDGNSVLASLKKSYGFQSFVSFSIWSIRFNLFWKFSRRILADYLNFFNMNRNCVRSSFFISVAAHYFVDFNRLVSTFRVPMCLGTTRQHRRILFGCVCVRFSVCVCVCVVCAVCACVLAVAGVSVPWHEWPQEKRTPAECTVAVAEEKKKKEEERNRPDDDETRRRRDWIFFFF